MKSFFGPKRRKAVGQTFLNIFTILVPASLTSERFVKISLPWKIGICVALVVVLVLGWLLTPEDKKRNDNDKEE